MMLRSRSARGVSVRTDDRARQHRDPKTVREATRGESRRMPLLTAVNGASTSTTTIILCQIARLQRPIDASGKNTLDIASQFL